MYQQRFRRKLHVVALVLALLALVMAVHADISHSQIADEPNWQTGALGKWECGDDADTIDEAGPIQQSDFLKPVLLDIAQNGLAHAYKKFKHWPGDGSLLEPEQTTNPKNIVIVGAGMAGLVAARELVKVGHNVTIVEMQDRIGGRVKTISGDGGGPNRTHHQNGTFKAGLYVDGKHFLVLEMLYSCRNDRRTPLRWRDTGRGVVNRPDSTTQRRLHALDYSHKTWNMNRELPHELTQHKTMMDHLAQLA